MSLLLCLSLSLLIVLAAVSLALYRLLRDAEED